MISMLIATGIDVNEIKPTMSCSRLSSLLYFFIIIYVEKLPSPIPSNIKN